MDKNKSQGQPNQDQPGKQPNQQGNQGERQRTNVPADNNPTGKSESQQESRQGAQGSQQSQTGAQQSAESKKPITNQDEQRQSTNAGKSSEAPVGEEESEGDKRLKPYKNVGDDSEEVEKKTPTME